MSKTLVIIGAGGHAKVCYDIAIAMNKWSKIVILDDNLENDFFDIQGYISNYVNYPNADFFVAIGTNDIRRKFSEMILEKGFKLATLIHPNTIISKSVQINVGTVIMPGVIINANTKIGKGVILNTAVTVDHDNIIKDFVHVSPGSHLAGNVILGKNTWIGMGTNIINNISVGSNIIIGAGSLVINNLNATGTYIGHPAKKR